MKNFDETKAIAWEGSDNRIYQKWFWENSLWDPLDKFGNIKDGRIRSLKLKNHIRKIKKRIDELERCE